MVSRSMTVWNHEKEAKGKIPSIPYWTGPYEGEDTFADQPTADVPKGVHFPMLVDSLEWVLDSPPNVHQFEEPPIIVEIEHLENLKVPDDE